MPVRSALSSRVTTRAGPFAVLLAVLLAAGCGGHATGRASGLASLRPQCTGATSWNGARCAARGTGRSVLARGTKALAAFNVDDALPLLERARRAAPHPYREHVAVYEQLGIALAYKGKEQEALESFGMLLSLSPGHLLSYTLSPKATFLFARARAKALSRGKPALHLRWPRELGVSRPVSVDVEVVSDPRLFLRRATLHVRRRGQAVFHALDLDLPGVGKVRRVRIPALRTRKSEVLQLYLTAYDQAGNEVLQWADAKRPRELSLRYTPATPWYRKWWVWAAIGGAVTATTGTTVYLLTREPPDTIGGDFSVR